MDWGVWEVYQKNCSLTPGPLYAGSLVEIVQEAFWFCDKTLGDFDSPEPDRSGCTGPWVDTLNDNMLSCLSTGEISVKIYDGFDNSPALGVLGGSQLKLSDFLPLLLDMYRNEDSTDNVFTQHILLSINMVLRSSTGWLEITDFERKNKGVSSYYTGFIAAEKEEKEEFIWHYGYPGGRVALPLEMVQYVLQIFR